MFWDGLFDHVSGLTGAPASQIKTITALLLAYPLASLYTRLPASRPNVSHVYSLAVSMFFLGPLLNLGTGVLHLLLSCLGTYGLVITFRGSKMPWIVFAFTMGHLMYNHIINYVYGIPATEIEVTFTQMVMVMNLTTFAWNVHDGRQKADDLDAGQLATRLLHVPSPLPFLGYCFFFPAFLIGPAFDYSTYDSLIKHTIFTTPPPGTNKEQVKATARRIPYGRKRVAYLHLVIGLVFLGVYAVYGGRGAYSRILTPSWKGWSMLERFGFVQFAGVIARTKYYGVWSLTEGACILTGLGFNGYDPKTGRTLWNRVRNVNIVTLETAESFKVVFDSWNCRTNVWLRDCVYKRLTSRGKKPGTAQSMATFVTSAIWHGVEPGYYLAFVSAGLLTSLGRQLRRLVRPYFLSQTTSEAPNSFPKYPYPNLYKRVYDVLGWFMVQINLNYVACAFMLLDLRSCLTAWHRMGWYGHIIIVLATVFFRGGGKGFLRNDLKKRGLEGGSKPKANGATGVGEKQEVPGINISPASPPPQPDDETNPKDLKWVKHALDNPGYQDSGEGVHPDGGFVDRWLDGAETPAVDKADYKEL